MAAAHFCGVAGVIGHRFHPEAVDHAVLDLAGDAAVVGFVKQELAGLWGLDVSHCPFRFSGIGDILLLWPALIKRTAPIGFMPAIKVLGRREWRH